MSQSRDQGLDEDPRVQEAEALYRRLAALRLGLAAAREAHSAVQLREGLVKAEEERFWDPEVVESEVALGQLLREARAALGRRDVQKMQDLLEGWLAEDWREAWDVGGGESWDLTKLKECAERLTEWQSMVREVRGAYERVMSEDDPEHSHWETFRRAFQRCEDASLRLPPDEEPGWRQALLYGRSSSIDAAAALWKALSCASIRLDRLEAALAMTALPSELSAEPRQLPKGLHLLAPLAARHRRRLLALRARLEAALLAPGAELLELCAEAEAYEVAGSRRSFEDPAVAAATALCRARGLQVLVKEEHLLVRLGPGQAPVQAVPAVVKIAARREMEEQFTTDAQGRCFLPEGLQGLSLSLADEPGLLPVQISLSTLRQGGWHREALRKDLQMLRAMVLPGSQRCYLALGGHRQSFPSHGWQPAELRLKGSAPRREACEEIQRIRRTVGHKALSVTLSWCSEEPRSDLDMWLEHPCGKRVSYKCSQCLECGAELDLDSPGVAGQMSLENISWPEAPPCGSYYVHVELFRGPKVPFQLLVQQEGVPLLFRHSSSYFDSKQAAAAFTITSTGLLSDSEPQVSAAGGWDGHTDRDGWCRLAAAQRAVCVAPPRGLGYEHCGPLEVALKDLPAEVLFPQRRVRG